MRTLIVSAVLAGLMLSGCATTSQTNMEVKVAPVAPTHQLEVTLARLNEILSSAELTEEQRARFHYDRGVRFDSVGLKTLARIDFHRALKLQPDLVDAYNFLGIYYTQDGEYESAYEAFDGVLELSPAYDYAYLNRGIALYYGGRNQLATEDMQAFYDKDSNDGYRALWLYIIQAQNNLEQATKTLAMQREKLTGEQWAKVLVDFYLGKLDQQQVFELAKQGLTRGDEYAERLCEAYFYMAKVAQLDKDAAAAAKLFRLTLATNIYDFVEHRYARLELQRMANSDTAH